MLPLRLAFFINDAATTGIYTLSLHDALPILGAHEGHDALPFLRALARPEGGPVAAIRAGEFLRIMAAHAVTLHEVLAPAVRQAEVLTRSCAPRHNDDRQKHPDSS